MIPSFYINIRNVCIQEKGFTLVELIVTIVLVGKAIATLLLDTSTAILLMGKFTAIFQVDKSHSIGSQPDPAIGIWSKGKNAVVFIG